MAIPTTGKIPPETLSPFVNQTGTTRKIVLTTSLPITNKIKTGIALDNPQARKPKYALRLATFVLLFLMLAPFYVEKLY